MSNARTLIESTMQHGPRAVAASHLRESDDKALGADMHQWHSSMGDPVYAVGSCLYAGCVSKISKDNVRDAIRNLRSNHDPDADSVADRLAAWAKAHGLTLGESQLDELYGADPRVNAAQIIEDAAKYLSTMLQRLSLLDLSHTQSDDRSEIKGFITQAERLQTLAKQTAESERMHGLRAELDMGT